MKRIRAYAQADEDSSPPKLSYEGASVPGSDAKNFRIPRRTPLIYNRSVSIPGEKEVQKRLRPIRGAVDESLCMKALSTENPTQRTTASLVRLGVLRF